MKIEFKELKEQIIEHYPNAKTSVMVDKITGRNLYYVSNTKKNGTIYNLSRNNSPYLFESVSDAWFDIYNMLLEEKKIKIMKNEKVTITKKEQNEITN